MRSSLIAICLVLGGGHLAAGCSRSGEASDEGPEALREAALLSRAIDQLRDADNAQKYQFLELLEAQPCLSFCALKQVCEGAYREHVAALEAIAEVKAYDTAIPTRPGADEQELVATKLAEAERRLRLARDLSSQCVDAQGAVKLRLEL